MVTLAVLHQKGSRTENWLDDSVPGCTEDLHPLIWVLHELWGSAGGSQIREGTSCRSLHLGCTHTFVVVLGSLRVPWKCSWSLEDSLTTSCYCLCLVLFLFFFSNSFR